jgi:predicted permease
MSAASSIAILKAFPVEPKRAASVFTSGMFSNIMTFGGLTAFILFNIEGYSLIQLFNLLIGPINYIVGYPMSHQISTGAKNPFIISPRIFKTRPYVLLPIAALLVGLFLHAVGLEQPAFLPKLRSVLIPVVTASMGVAIGLTLSLGRIGKYRKELAMVFFIKFIISPAVMALIAFAFGLHTMMDGIPFKVTIVASAMPVAFNALIPPSIYGFDLDLANSAWLTTTLAFAAVLPVLYTVLSI